MRCVCVGKWGEEGGGRNSRRGSGRRLGALCSGRCVLGVYEILNSAPSTTKQNKIDKENSRLKQDNYENLTGQKGAAPNC